MPGVIKEILRTFAWVIVIDYVLFGLPTRSAVGYRYLHYIAVVGFDEEYIYTADSLENHVNSDSKLYNRRVPIADFNTP